MVLWEISVPSQGLTSPSALQSQAAKCPLGWDEPLHLPCLSSFQTGVVTHLPVPAGSRLPTPWLAGHLRGREHSNLTVESDSVSTSCWLEPPGSPACLGLDDTPFLPPKLVSDHLLALGPSPDASCPLYVPDDTGQVNRCPAPLTDRASEAQRRKDP